jgi:hypothetical protein
VAIEKGCRLIGVNLNNCRFKDGLCPSFFADKGALFVPFSSRILATALTWNRLNPAARRSPDLEFFTSFQSAFLIEKGHSVSLSSSLGGVDTPAAIRYGRAAELADIQAQNQPVNC